MPPWERTVELTGRAHRAGLRLSLGTDAGCIVVFHRLAVHRELELLVRAGLTPLEALTAATGSAAAKVGADDRLGTVEVGKQPTSWSCGRTPSRTSAVPGPSTW